MPHRKRETSPARVLSLKGGSVSVASSTGSPHTRRTAPSPSAESSRTSKSKQISLFAVGPGAFGSDHYAQLPKPAPVRRTPDEGLRGFIELCEASSSGKSGDSRAQSTVNYAMSLAGASMVVGSTMFGQTTWRPQWEQVTMELLVREESDRRVIDRQEEARRTWLATVDAISVDEMAARQYWASAADGAHARHSLCWRELSRRALLTAEELRTRRPLVLRWSLLTLQREEQIARREEELKRCDLDLEWAVAYETLERDVLSQRHAALATGIVRQWLCDWEVVLRSDINAAAEKSFKEFRVLFKNTPPRLAPQRPPVEARSAGSPRQRERAAVVKMPSGVPPTSKPPSAPPQRPSQSPLRGNLDQKRCRFCGSLPGDSSSASTVDVGVQTDLPRGENCQSPARVTKMPSRPRRAAPSPRNPSPPKVGSSHGQRTAPPQDSTKPPMSRPPPEGGESEARMAQLYHTVLQKLSNRPAGAELADFFPCLRQLQIRQLTIGPTDKPIDPQGPKGTRRPASAKSRSSAVRRPSPKAVRPLPLPNFQYEL